MRKALIVGGTGLVGGLLLDRLLTDPRYGEVRALVRRPLEEREGDLVQVIADFESLEDHVGRFNVDDVFCCLGTTIKKAGSEAAFRRVDHDYVAQLARLAREAGARTFCLISSIGADAESGNFYLRVKGEAEASVEECGFESLRVFRPSLLLGPRQESRPAEKAGIVAARLFAPLLLGPLRKYRPVEAETLAGAMLEAACSDEAGRRVHLYLYGDIRRLASGPGAS